LATRADNIDELPGKFLECRDLGHNWSGTKQGKVIVMHRSEGLVTRNLRCGRCTTKRTELIVSASGEKIGNKYEYAEGYLLKPGEGRPSPSYVRQITLRAMASAMRGR